MPGSVHLRDGPVTLDDNELGVALDMLPGARPTAASGHCVGRMLTLAARRGDGDVEGPVAGRSGGVDGMVYRSH
jgi:hypothetical protein